MRHPPFMFSFIGRNGIFNTLDNPSSRICVPNKSKDIVVNVFYFDNRNKWIKNINKAYLYENEIKIKNRITINVNVFIK